MPYTVAFSFDKFRENIELSGDHRETATARKDRVVSLLENDFEILDAFATGSIPRFTAVRGHADLDVMVVLHHGKHIKDKTPSAVLQEVRDSLGEYKTNVRKNGQAVTLHYETWPDVDIVPVSRTVNDQGGVTHYNVPDMDTESWIASKPHTHSKAMSKTNEQCGVEFKRIIKMIKWWNHQHSLLLQSFHIEVMGLKIFTTEIGEYSWNIFKFFDEAAKLTSSSLWHEGGQADRYLVDSIKRQEVLTRLEKARDKARDAWYSTYGENADHEKAINIWRQMFGSEFPAYRS
jgi:hypothetical protein